MPANYLILGQLIQKSMPSFFEAKKRTVAKADDASQLLRKPIISHENLRLRSDDLFAAMGRIMRWAGPSDEIYFDQFPASEIPDDITLVATDGSQRIPNPATDGNILSGVLWGITNVGAITWPRQNGQFLSMTEHVDTALFLENSLFTTENTRKTEEHISLLRDVHEREYLTEIAMRVGPNTLAILDSEIEIWGAKDSQLAGDFQSSLRRVVEIYTMLRDHNIPYVGYIDSARSELLVRLLEIGALRPKDVVDYKRIRRNRLFPMVSDEMVLRNWLKPGYRTALFKLCTESQGAFPDHESLRPYLCYLNVGEDKRPRIVRVNFPAWLASDKARVDQIVGILFDQCKKTGNVRYPWILHRSHEVAVIKQEEHDGIRQMIMAEYLKYEYNLSDPSAKQALKNLSRRDR